MAKVYHVGDEKDKDKNIYHIYYNITEDSFTCTDQNGDEIPLTPKMHSRIAKKYNLKRAVHIALYEFKVAIFTSAFLFFGLSVIHYRHVLFDLPKIIDISRSHDPERLKEKTVEYINKNDSLTFEQKEYLSNTFSLYLEDYGDCYEFKAFLDMLNSFSSVDIEYKESRESGTTGTYSPFFNEIELFTDNKQSLAHEFSHCSSLNFMSQVLREGYADAIKTSYGYEGFPDFWERFEAKKIPDYTNENEYLLLISEIIGKEKTMYYLINGKEDEMKKEIAFVTSTDFSDIHILFYFMNEQFRADKNDEEERSKTLASQVKQKLASLAISANKKNENNFIIQNAISQDYIVGSSFLMDEYLFYDDQYEDFIIIDDTNKFDEDYSRTKSFFED